MTTATASWGTSRTSGWRRGRDTGCQAELHDITGQIRPNLINTFHVGFVRNRNRATRQSIAQSAQELGISGTQTANGRVGLTPSTSIVNTPIDISHSARTQSER